MLYRDAQADDINFILSSWLMSFKEDLELSVEGNIINQLLNQKSIPKNRVRFKGCIPSAAYFSCMETLIKIILKNSSITIAHDPEDDTHVVGYVVYNKLPGDQLLVHWVYVKNAFRKLGIAKALIYEINTSGDTPLASFDTETARDLADKIPYSFNRKLLETLLV